MQEVVKRMQERQQEPQKLEEKAKPKFDGKLCIAKVRDSNDIYPVMFPSNCYGIKIGDLVTFNTIGKTHEAVILSYENCQEDDDVWTDTIIALGQAPVKAIKYYVLRNDIWKEDE